MRGYLSRLPARSAVAAGALCTFGITLPQPAAAAGDPAKGATVFGQCQACHSADKGANRIGPSLYHVVGRPAGSIAGYDYSPAVQEAAKKGLVWTAENIVKYLQNPHKFLGDFDGDPGIRNKMPFSLADEQQREDVVAYLKSLGDKP
ncbi:MAG: cytochrome c family protein [Alphaproteobacteria bacterium]|nr:cytochrome c family protein [Alphaproteobacteria bacterium]